VPDHNRAHRWPNRPRRAKLGGLATDWKGAGMLKVGNGAYVYEPVENWAKLPPGWSFKEIGGVGVDKNDNVYVFNRGAHPMIVFDRDGNLLRSFGEGLFPRAHGVFMAPDDTIWLTDDGDHTVRQCTLAGKVLLTLGISGKPAPFMSGEPFHRCTHTAMSPQGDIYVSDGYGNARVHKYAPNGKLLLSWGGPGSDPGEFNIAHNITCDADGWVYVADRENHRVQVFDGNGKYETQWNNLHRPCGLFMPPGKCPVRSRSRQNDPEFGELTGLRIDLYSPAVLLDDDVVTDGQAKPSSFTGGLRRKERAEQLLLHLGRNAGAVVAYPDFDAVAKILSRGRERGLTVASIRFSLFRCRVKAVGDQVEQRPRNLLWEQIGLTGGRVKGPLQGDIEALLLGAGTVIGQIEALLHESIDIDRPVLSGPLTANATACS
jgi:NHL repeat